MAITEKVDKILTELYKDPKTGLRGIDALYEQVKKHGFAYNPKVKQGITKAQVKEWYDSYEELQVYQSKKKTYNSFVAENALEQFQIDLVYMPKSYFNNGYKYIFCCVDVFSKKADMIPLKVRDQRASVNAMEEILKNLGTPKQIYSDQGAEFDNELFQALMKQHKIELIFATDHASFVESFNRTMKNRMYKYMHAHHTDQWAKIIPELLNAYNDTPHSSTKIAPNDINKSNEIEARMNIIKRSRKKNYTKVNVGDEVRVPVKQKIDKDYKQHWTYETYKVQENEHNGLYKVNGRLHPRKDLQVIQGVVRKFDQPSKATLVSRDIAEKIGKGQVNTDVRDLLGLTPTKKAVKEALTTGKPTRRGRTNLDYSVLQNQGIQAAAAAGKSTRNRTKIDYSLLNSKGKSYN